MFTRAATTIALVLSACGGDTPAGPPIPDKDARIETAKLIDDLKGFEKFTIGQHLRKVVNVGKPDSYEYVGDGVKLAAYRKARVKVKVGEVAFEKVTLYFGKTNELQMYKLYQPTDRPTCDTAKTKFDELFGPGYPKNANKYTWTGFEVMATWEHVTVRGTPTCYMEVRAVIFR